MNLINEEQNWYTFASKLNSYLIDKGYKMDESTDYSLLGSSVHGIFQARILAWISISFSRASFQPQDQTRVSCIAGRVFTI